MSVEITRKLTRTKCKLYAGENPNDTLRQTRQEITFADLFTFLSALGKMTKATLTTTVPHTLGNKKLGAIPHRDISP